MRALFLLRYPTTDLWLMYARRAYRAGMTPAQLGDELKRNYPKPEWGGGAKAAASNVSV